MMMGLNTPIANPKLCCPWMIYSGLTYWKYKLIKIQVHWASILLGFACINVIILAIEIICKFQAVKHYSVITNRFLRRYLISHSSPCFFLLSQVLFWGAFDTSELHSMLYTVKSVSCYIIHIYNVLLLSLGNPLDFFSPLWPNSFGKLVFIFVTLGHETWLYSKESKQTKIFPIFTWLPDFSLNIALYNQIWAFPSLTSRDCRLSNESIVDGFFSDNVAPLVTSLSFTSLPHFLVQIFSGHLQDFFVRSGTIDLGACLWFSHLSYPTLFPVFSLWSHSKVVPHHCHCFQSLPQEPWYLDQISQWGILKVPRRFHVPESPLGTEM